MAQNILMHAWDAVTKRLREVEWTGGAMKVYVASLAAGENQTLNVQETINGGNEYETVAAAQTDQVLGSVGAVGDYLDSLLLTVGAATAITVKDNATTIFTFTFGAAVTTGPVEIPIRCKSVSGAWKVTTGASMTALAKGLFS